MIIDTHCHLNFNSFTDDLPAVLKRANEFGIGRIIVPAIDLNSCREVLTLAATYPEIYVAVGVHPSEADMFNENVIPKLREFAANDKVVAIGEIGLDNFHKDVPIGRQVLVFNAQLTLAAELALPILVHNREADQEIMNCLEPWLEKLKHQKSPLAKNPGIMHAFSSDLSFARKVVSMGFAVGAAGPITFKNSHVRQEVFKNLEPVNIVLETDAPFLAPHPFRGKRNEPSHCKLISKKLSELWEIPEKEVEHITTNNAARIFKWKELTQIIQ